MKKALYKIYDTRNKEILFVGTKPQVLKYIWNAFTEGFMGIEIGKEGDRDEWCYDEEDPYK